jgi:gamma-glutamylcyclotransferase (GGCT)/AIG2-like uncharacterized protein YtfP
MSRLFEKHDNVWCELYEKRYGQKLISLTSFSLDQNAEYYRKAMSTFVMLGSHILHLYIILYAFLVSPRAVIAQSV